ncbi:hypothetical protein TPHA_0E03030 [Tetrapisispora phaffii CBS 4417]|uniref:ELMO domain-containing protein n=1 Tax=Tetrapisispora phaffii (strain ATCC 24235 / CBS 4417 / NBRC 1672 / NRRL Y-8282 / UCD 70-5) TaxID=1071381 RepID=G8BU15_TETPH|nr:hypothetical protein TPHA_0E03030 [Tetrapisispora phaffii CBS 4417]CCE63393.1 hypothetical protein TPHA_0E03030 [Tetrapisispora phaffii CBS 4417]
MKSTDKIKKILEDTKEDDAKLSFQDSVAFYKSLIVSADLSEIRYADLISTFFLVCDEDVLLNKVFVDQKSFQVIASIVNSVDYYKKPNIRIIEDIFNKLCRTFGKAVRSSGGFSYDFDKIYNNFIETDLIKNVFLLIDDISNNYILDDFLISFICTTLKGISLLFDILNRFLKNDTEKAIRYIFHDSNLLILNEGTHLFVKFLTDKTIKSTTNDILVPSLLSFSHITREIEFKGFWTDLLTKVASRLNKIFDYKIIFNPTGDNTSFKYYSHKDFQLSEYIDSMIFLNSYNLAFQKSVGEQLLFDKDNNFSIFDCLGCNSLILRKFISSFEEDALFQPLLAGLLLGKNLIMFELMNKFLKFWITSHANGTSKHDFLSIADLIEVTMHKLKKNISDDYASLKDDPSKLINTCIDFLNGIAYEEARNIQVHYVYRKHVLKWAPKMQNFEELLFGQVFDYVKHQKIVQLQKGFWFYTENPLRSNLENPKVSYLIISDNQRDILIREFDVKTTDKPYFINNEIICDSVDPINHKGVRKPKTKTITISFSEIKRFTTEKNILSKSNKMGTNDHKDSTSLNSVDKSVSSDRITDTSISVSDDFKRRNSTDNAFIKSLDRQKVISIKAVNNKEEPLIEFFFINNEDSLIDDLKFLLYSYDHEKIPVHSKAKKADYSEFKVLYLDDIMDPNTVNSPHLTMMNNIIRDLTLATQEQIKTLIHVRYNIKMINLSVVDTNKSKDEKTDTELVNVDEHDSNEDDVYNFDTLISLSKNTYYA